MLLVAAALVFAARPRLAAAGLAAAQCTDAALAAHFVPRYESRLAHLQAENAALHTRLADAQAALAENDALRQWAGTAEVRTIIRSPLRRHWSRYARTLGFAGTRVA